MMKSKIIVTVAAALISTLVSLHAASAGAADYAFEPVRVEIKKGDDVTVAVRLTHKPTGKSVGDAVIVQSRIDMAPDGMAEMASAISPLPSREPGIYAFKTDLSMVGRWQLSVAAKVQGEPETIVGKVILNAVK